MKNNFKIILLIVIVVLGVSIYYLTRNNTQVVKENPSVVATDSLVGCYVAHLAKDVYTLNIQSDNNGVVSGILAYNNSEKDSSSGSFSGVYKDGILLGKYSFDSEGSHSERQVIFKKVLDSFIQGFGPVKVIDGEESFDPISSVTYDSKSTFVKSKNCLEKFTDSNNVLTFEHNSFFQHIEGVNYPSTDWKAGTEEKGILLASVIIPRTYMQSTNFSNARLTIGRGTTANTIKSCTTASTTNGEIKDSTVMISGYPFTKFTLSDAGAGNFYETTSYRGILDGDCYVVEYTIHSTNIGNYSPDQNIKEFDKPMIKNNLEKIIQSLHFNINSD